MQLALHSRDCQPAQIIEDEGECIPLASSTLVQSPRTQLNLEWKLRTSQNLFPQFCRVPSSLHALADGTIGFNEAEHLAALLVVGFLKT